MRIRWSVVPLAGALLLSACGSRLSEQDLLAGQAQEFGVTGRSGPIAATAGPDASEQANRSGFSVESPCGPGDAKGATAVGVTDTEIHIGTIADVTGPKPGLNKGLHDSMQAFGDWCNQLGGINGRKLVVELLDSKLLEYQATIKGACSTEFALVGGLGVLDNTGAQDGVDCGIINVPAAGVSAEQAEAENTVMPQPNPIRFYNVGPAKWVAKNFPEVPKKAAALYNKVPVTEAQSARLREAYEQAGFTFIYKEATNVNETNWSPVVLNMKNQGVQYMTLTSSFEEIIPLQASMAQQGFKPLVVDLEANYYNQKYPDSAGETAEGTFVKLTSWPFEEADRNPAMTKYLELLKSSVPDAVPELLGVQSFSAGMLFATAAKRLGSNLTREGLLKELKGIHEWNGGGLHGRSDPGANKPSTCFIMLEIKDGKYVRRFPLEDADAEIYKAGNGMSCPPFEEGMAPLKGDYGTGAKKKS